MVSGAVAAGYVALALADGGFAPAIWAEATILVWWTVLCALLAQVWPRSRVPAAAALTGVGLLALTALTGASLAWSTDLGAAYDDALRGAGYLGTFVLTAIAARAGGGRAFLGGIAVGLCAVCALALLSRLEPGLVESGDEARGLRVSGGRLSWPLGYWNALGACAGAAVPLLVWLATSAGAAWRRSLFGAAIPIILLTLFFSGSRSGQFAVWAALAVLLLAGPRRVTMLAVTAISVIPAIVLVGLAGTSPELVNGESTGAAAAAGDRVLVLSVVTALVVAGAMFLADRRLPRLQLPVIGTRRAAVFAGAIVCAVAALAVLSSDPAERLRSFDDPPSTTQATESGTRLQAAGSSGRAQFWGTALDAFAGEPLRGIGAGGYESYWALNGSLDFTVSHAHSLFLESAAELGLLGAMLAVGIFVVPAGAGVRRLRAPTSWASSETATGGLGAALAVLAAGATVAAVDWVWDVPAAFIPAIIAAAYLCMPPAVERVAERRERFGGIGVALAVIAAGVASIAGAGVLLMSELELDESERGVGEGRLHEAAASARDATEWAPFAADPYRQLALVEQLRERPAAARAAIEEAQERAEQDWRLWYTEAGIELADGRAGQGLYALNRARSLNPKAPRSLFAYPSALSASTDAAPAEGSDEGG